MGIEWRFLIKNQVTATKKCYDSSLNYEKVEKAMIKLLSVLLVTIALTSLLQAESGKKVFETYCWGCHHQTAEAFGPSFEEIASKRSADEINAMITDPAAVSKVFGYKRNAMPPFKLTSEEMDAVTAYILTFKPNTKEK